MQISILPPYNGLEHFFVTEFEAFPVVNIPEDIEDRLDFKDKLINLLAAAAVNDVDVVIQHGEKIRIIQSIEEFEFSYNQLKEIHKTENTEALHPGNYWAISSDPFEVSSATNPYDNDVTILPRWVTPLGGDLGGNPEMELPPSNFSDKARIPSGSELRIVDRLAKYGESMPFLNEDGSLSPQALKDFDEMLSEGEADDALLAFMSKGIEGAKSVFDGAAKAGKFVGDMLGLTKDGKQNKLDKEQIKLEREKVKKVREELKGKNDGTSKITPEEVADIVERLGLSRDNVKDEAEDLDFKLLAAPKTEDNADDKKEEAEDLKKVRSDLNALKNSAEAAVKKGVKGASKIAKEAEDIKDEIKNKIESSTPKDEN